jgi:hypothetical protein
MNPAQNIGKYFRFNLDQGTTVQNRALLDRGIKTGAEAHWAANTMLTAARGGGAGTAWNFTFLKYWPGAITRCLIGNGVLTGPMSGCILCRFQNSGGPSVAHVGTDVSPTNPNTIGVKADWTAYMASKPHGNFMGRKPTQVINDLDVFAEAKAGNLQPLTGYQVWGYFRPGEAWALLLHRGGDGVNQIIRARPMELLPWAAIPGSW